MAHRLDSIHPRQGKAGGREVDGGCVQSFGVEVCMGMGIPMGFPWDSRGNGSSFGLLMGMEIAYFIGEK